MKKFRGIRYGFRPKSYCDHSDQLKAILKNVKGENRRRMVIDYWNAGHLEKLDATLLQNQLGAEERRSLGLELGGVDLRRASYFKRLAVLMNLLMGAQQNTIRWTDP